MSIWLNQAHYCNNAWNEWESSPSLKDSSRWTTHLFSALLFFTVIYIYIKSLKPLLLIKTFVTRLLRYARTKACGLMEGASATTGAFHDEPVYGGLTDDGSPLREDESAGKMPAMLKFPASWVTKSNIHHWHSLYFFFTWIWIKLFRSRFLFESFCCRFSLTFLHLLLHFVLHVDHQQNFVPPVIYKNIILLFRAVTSL